MDFSAALLQAKAGKTISRPSGLAYVWITGVTAASGPLAKIAAHLATVTVLGTLQAFPYLPVDVAATDWVAA